VPILSLMKKMYKNYYLFMISQKLKLKS